MTVSPRDAENRAARLVRWYPREWRLRYGDEFSELLAAQIVDQPRSRVRTADVVFGAIMARLAAAGLSGTTVDPSHRPRRSLATLGCALAAFMPLALSIWSHLIIAQRWATPVTPATHTAIVMMTAAVVVCIGAAGAASVPLAWAAIRAALGKSDSSLRKGALLFLFGGLVLVAGALAFHNGWSSTGAEPLTPLVPQSAGPHGWTAFIWTSTMAVSAYWVHPGVLFNLPTTELAWMAIDPVALAAAVIGTATLLRRLDLSTRLFRFVVFSGQVATTGLGLFLAGTAIWIVDGGPGPGQLFQPGTVDQIGLVLMAAALIVALRSLQRTTVTSAAR